MPVFSLRAVSSALLTFANKTGRGLLGVLVMAWVAPVWAEATAPTLEPSPEVSQSPEKSTQPTPALEIALNAEAAADKSSKNNKNKVAGPSSDEGATTEASEENSTEVIAPNVDLKEVAPVPEVNTSEATKKATAKASTEEKAKPIPGEETATTADSQKTPEKTKTMDRSNTANRSNTTDRPITAGQGKKLPASPKAEAADSPVKSSLKAVIDSLKGEPSAGVVEEHSFSLLGAKVPPNTSTRLAWQPEVAITGLALPVPVLVINGKKPGETLCLTAAIHGDELNGIEVVRRVMYDINPEKLSGQIIGIPIVNLQGFQRASRYLVDRRDLNRHFPGEKKGSLASRIAYSLFNEVIRHCTILVDLHTGSLRRTNLPQLRADMSDPQVAKFTEDFDEMVVVHSAGESGMLRTAAQKIGIPAVTLEIGESLRLQEDQVDSGVKSINSLMDRRKMYTRFFSWGDPEPIYYKSSWIRAEQGGILFSDTNLGDKVEKGQVLGIVTDPITNAESKIKAPYAGRVIGMAVNQVVMPGFAAYHLGAQATERDISEAAAQAVKQEPSLDNESEDINPEESDPLESDPLE